MQYRLDTIIVYELSLGMSMVIKLSAVLKVDNVKDKLTIEVDNSDKVAQIEITHGDYTERVTITTTYEDLNKALRRHLSSGTRTLVVDVISKFWKVLNRPSVSTVTEEWTRSKENKPTEGR